MNWNFLVPIGLLPLLLGNVNAALAGSASVFRTASGDTVFPEQTVGCRGDVVHYSTRYQGKSYQGTLWINSPSGHGCEGGRGRFVKGTFKERSQDGTEQCQGQLSLYLTLDPRGGSSVQWTNIQASSGYHCSGIGTAPKLPLFYATTYHD